MIIRNGNARRSGRVYRMMGKTRASVVRSVRAPGSSGAFRPGRHARGDFMFSSATCRRPARGHFQVKRLLTTPPNPRGRVERALLVRVRSVYFWRAVSSAQPSRTTRARADRRRRSVFRFFFFFAPITTSARIVRPRPSPRVSFGFPDTRSRGHAVT